MIFEGFVEELSMQMLGIESDGFDIWYLFIFSEIITTI